MAIIPLEYKRVLEDQIDRLLLNYCDTVTPFSSWLFRQAFPECELLSVHSALPHQHRDHRRASGDPLAYGETDIEVVATIQRSNLRLEKVGLLIENKIDAKQMDKQGKRYRARAEYRIKSGSWSSYRCVLFAPHSYLEAQYFGSNFEKDGWHKLIEYEEAADVLSEDANSIEDARTILLATTIANSWNKPIPQAVQFWKDYVSFGEFTYPEIPVFVRTSQGSRVGGVWPSFYDNQLSKNPRESKRKRVQIVHIDTASHVALFLKRVSFHDFSLCLRDHLDAAMCFAPAGGSWQSVRLRVPSIEPTKPFTQQVGSIHQVYGAARRFFEFYVRHESAMLNIPILKSSGSAATRLR